MSSLYGLANSLVHFYVRDVRHMLVEIQQSMAREQIASKNIMRQHQYARRAMQNAQNIRNRNIAHMQRTRRK